MKAAAILVAGAAAALLAGCGGTSGLIPASHAGTLQTDLNNISDDVVLQDCTQTDRDLATAQRDLGQLPQSVNGKLRSNLSEGFKELDVTARLDCQGATSSTGLTGLTGSTSTTGTSGATSSTGATGTSTTSTSSTTSSASSTATTTSSAATTSGPTGPSSGETTGTGGGTPAGDTPTGSTPAGAGIGGGGGASSGP